MRNLTEIAARAQRTKIWFEYEEVQIIFDELEVDILTMWVQSASDDADGREMLYREIHGLRALKERIKKIIAAGKKAEEEMKHGN